MKRVILSIVAIGLLTLSAEAGRRDQSREHRQQSRIKQGVKSGELTRHEAKRLRKGQKHIDHMQVKANADGVMTPAEKAKIEKAQDKQSALIYKQKHDEQVRGANQPQPVPSQPSVESGSESKE